MYQGDTIATSYSCIFIFIIICSDCYLIMVDYTKYGGSFTTPLLLTIP